MSFIYNNRRTYHALVHLTNKVESWLLWIKPREIITIKNLQTNHEELVLRHIVLFETNKLHLVGEQYIGEESCRSHHEDHHSRRCFWHPFFEDLPLANGWTCYQLMNNCHFCNLEKNLLIIYIVFFKVSFYNKSGFVPLNSWF